MYDGPPLYEFEIWDNDGNAIADLSPLMKNRGYSQELNAAETLRFSVDLNEFEEFCRDKLKADPTTVLAEYQTDVKVKRAGDYLFGTQIVAIGIDGGAESETVSVTGSGYLDLFKDRTITKTYSGVDSAVIAQDIVTTVQAITGGNMGVTVSSTPHTTGVLRDQSYQRDNAALRTS